LADSDAHGLYNIGSGEAHSWNDLARAVFHALRLPVNVEYIDMPEVLRGKYQYYTKADIGKLRAAGYDRAVTPLGAAVHDYVTRYLVPDRRLGDELPPAP